MNDATAQQALKLWGMQNASLTLIAQRENIVYRVTTSKNHQSWALRLHRQGLRSNIELQSEAQWMQALSHGGLSVPIPVESRNKQLCEKVDDQWVDLQVWLAGDTLAQHHTCEYLRGLGVAMALLHTLSDNWKPPLSFTRPSWNHEGLVGPSPVWGEFWKNPALDKEQKLLLSLFRTKASHALNDLENTLDYGLIHADLVSDNVLVDGENLHLIDFDDSGFGYRLFDLATVILRLRRETDSEALISAVIDGYSAKRDLDIDALNLFLALRACTYVGWIIPRMNESQSAERCSRFIKTACEHVDKWLFDYPER